MEAKVKEELQRITTGKELVNLLDYIVDEILITDSTGKVVAVTPSCREVYGMEPDEVIGTTVADMEKAGVHYPSVSPIVMKEKRKVTILQTNRLGRKILVTGVPVMDETGEIYRVVLNCRDVTDILEFKEEFYKGGVYLDGILPEQKELYPLRVVSTSSAMQELMQMVRKVSKVDCNLLITGESGVGKEVIAKEIHLQGNRKNGSFVHINCSAIPEQLLESELFGYESGAFTGADRKGKPGMFEIANNGTLFLDEIGEMPISLQAKLLKAIEDKQIMRLGGTKAKGINCRIIAATNENLLQQIREGKFREDLFYRLNVVPLYVPPLRERREDIAPLVNLFLDLKGRTYKRNLKITDDGMKVLLQYAWPGNVRELSNVIERLIVLTEDRVIHAEDIEKCLQWNKVSGEDRIK